MLNIGYHTSDMNTARWRRPWQNSLLIDSLSITKLDEGQSHRHFQYNIWFFQGITPVIIPLRMYFCQTAFELVAKTLTESVTHAYSIFSAT